MQMNIYQFIVSIPLFMVLAFGLGFILNMIVKTTWMPIVLYFLIAGYSVFDRIGELRTSDYVILISGLVGVALSSYVIVLLRKKGFRMF
ncbi:YuiB family protein [Numidum massiliense]|uniref:YuiB family protein n=1 Tax=Numidum massiliense TaxID=1522315 RepID=UPI0009EB8D83